MTLRSTRSARLRQTLVLAPVVVFAVSGVFGLRAFLIGESTQEAVHLMLVALIGTGMLCVISGGVYTLFGDSPDSHPTYWPTVLVSVTVGALGGTALYLLIAVLFLAHVDPRPTLAAVAPLIGQFSLLGGLDGGIMGSGIGFFIDALDSRATSVMRTRVARYLLLYTIAVALMALYVLLGAYLKVNQLWLDLGLFLLILVGRSWSSRP